MKLSPVKTYGSELAEELETPLCLLQERAYTDGWRDALRGLRMVTDDKFYRMGYTDAEKSKRHTPGVKAQ